MLHHSEILERLGEVSKICMNIYLVTEAQTRRISLKIALCSITYYYNNIDISYYLTS